MKKEHIIVVMIAIASILLVSIVQEKVLGDEPANINPKFKYLELPTGGELRNDTVNELGIRTAFHFSAGDEFIDTFKLFDTKKTGFDRNRGIANFVLQGVVSGNHPLLYEAVDKAYYIGTSENANHDFKIFDVDVVFSRGTQPYRVFSYDDCKVKNYNIVTLFDKEETYSGKTKFVYLDQFEFECRGAILGNPTYDLMKQTQVKDATDRALKNLDQTKNGKQ